MALAPNFHDPQGRIAGFCCRWVYLKHASSRCRLSAQMAPGWSGPCPSPTARAASPRRPRGLLDRLRENDQIVFQFCDEDGTVDESRAINPKWRPRQHRRRLCNPEGNVLAMMPHPERASFLRQVPASWAANGPKPRAKPGAAPS